MFYICNNFSAHKIMKIVNSRRVTEAYHYFQHASGVIEILNTHQYFVVGISKTNISLHAFVNFGNRISYGARLLNQLDSKVAVFARYDSSNSKTPCTALFFDLGDASFGVPRQTIEVSAFVFYRNDWKE